MSDTLRRSFVLIVVVAAAGGLYYWQHRQRGAPVPVAAPPAAAEIPAPDAQPLIRHPVPNPGAATESLPDLDKSDGAVRRRLVDLIGSGPAGSLFNPRDYIRRIVVTVDNLTQRRLPQRYAPLRPVKGEFQVKEGKDGTQTIDPGNYARYTPYVRLAQAVDIPKLVAVYEYFYPLFQRAYNDLGYQGRYFNDRLIAVIDNLLDAPEVEGPIKVTQPGVFYKYADPKLESLSAGQKIMVRMGPYNAKQVKVRLRDLREALVKLGGDQQK